MENETAPDGATPPPSAGYYRDTETGGVYYLSEVGDRISLSEDGIIERLNTHRNASIRYESRYHEANSTITDYTDWRLEEMWEKAGRIADEAGHCSVYDDLVRRLGGIPRQREYTVSIPVNGYVHVVVTASSVDEAMEFARDCADEDDAENLEFDWYSAEVEQS